MPIPNLSELERAIESQRSSTYTICCVNCKKELWDISDIKKYGTKTSSKKVAYPGVPEYDDIWSTNGKECSQVNCPFCEEPWLKAIKAGDKVFARPFVKQFGN